MATREEILDHAQSVLDAQGAGAVTISEIARRMGVRPPSLYKHVASLHAVHDGLFARGQARLTAYLLEAIADHEPGFARLRVANAALVRWTTLEPGLASLIFWRPVPGFEPSPDSFAPAQELLRLTRAELGEAVTRGDLAPEADSDEAVRLLTVLVAGIYTQQASNQPGVSFEEGLFTSLTDTVLDLFLHRYRPTAPPKDTR